MKAEFTIRFQLPKATFISSEMARSVHISWIEIFRTGKRHANRGWDCIKRPEADRLCRAKTPVGIDRTVKITAKDNGVTHCKVQRAG